jgi:outer membrane autotransporter protein
MQYKKLLLAMALSGLATQSHATYPTLESMLDNFAPVAPVYAPELNQLIIRLNALDPYPQLQQDALLTLVPLADGSLRAAIDGPMRQVMSVIGERLLIVDMNEDAGYAAGDEPVATHPAAANAEAINKAIHSALTKKLGLILKSDNTKQTAIADASADSAKIDQPAADTSTKTPEVSSTENTKAVQAAPVTSPKPAQASKNTKSSKVEKASTEAASKPVDASTSTASADSTKTDSSSTDADSKSTDKADDSSSVATSSKASSTDNLPDLTKATKINGVWGQLLGDHIKQEMRDYIPGYRADVLGGVIGRDLYMAPLFTAGVAGGYQHARVTQTYLSGSYLSIDRYQGTAYARYHFCDWPIYILGAATLAANGYDNSRYILVYPTDDLTQYSIIANSQFTGWETDVYLESGFVWKCGNFRAIPKLMLTFSHLDLEAYDEADAYGLDLTIKYQDMDELTLGVGAKFDYRNRYEKAYVVPEFHAYYFYDFINDSQVSTAQFFSGGYAFLSQGPAPSPNTVEVGVAMAVHSYRNTVVKLQYDYTARSDYHRNGAFIKVRYEWA